MAFICAASAVAGCGGGSGEDAYCGALKKDQGVFADDSSGMALIGNLPALHRLAAKAPDDLDDEWQTVLSALDSLDEAIEKAGVKPGDFANGQPPAGLSATEKTRIAQAASEVADQDVVDAFSGIDQQARDVCKLQLGL
ncbi:MAG: hypothetical protein J7518_06805 [Nocardioidaceae bacterium]|nr:hypothetical protein [Nocardioidaceae bacterium]